MEKSRHNSFRQQRFTHFGWPLNHIPERVAAVREDKIMNMRATDTSYPIRALRYWWVSSAVAAEVKKKNTETIIADIGCSTGHSKRFIGELPDTKWIGLDWKIEEPMLKEIGYSASHECDFDQKLPLPDSSVDVVIFSHVIEHLPRPDFTINEIARILRPGGLLIAGSPVAPNFVAKWRDAHHRKNYEAGSTMVGGHINSFSSGRWKRLLTAADMGLEQIAGTFLIRWSGFYLENFSWWIRLNQLWGALFPSYGGEVYLTARKNSSG